MNEITLFFKPWSDLFATRNGWKAIVICATGLRRYVSVPANTKKIVLCFTKRAREDSFEIELEHARSMQGRLVDHPYISLANSFAFELGTQLNKGYKFLHVEY